MKINHKNYKNRGFGNLNDAQFKIFSGLVFICLNRALSGF